MHFEDFLWYERCTLASCHSDSALETIEWSMLKQVSCPYLHNFKDTARKKSHRKKKMMMMIMIVMKNQMKAPKV